MLSFVVDEELFDVGTAIRRRGLREHNKVVSCTRICSGMSPTLSKFNPSRWMILCLKRYRLGKESNSIPKIRMYDQRTPSDHTVIDEPLKTLCESKRSSVERSSYYLFHKIKTSYPQSSNVEIDSYCEAIPEVTEVLPPDLEDPHLPFNDDYDIKSSSFKSMVDLYVETITETEIQKIERITNGQSNNEAWRALKQNKLTASTFHAHCCIFNKR